jgi:hypothetical protein
MNDTWEIESERTVGNIGDVLKLGLWKIDIFYDHNRRGGYHGMADYLVYGWLNQFVSKRTAADMMESRTTWIQVVRDLASQRQISTTT